MFSSSNIGSCMTNSSFFNESSERCSGMYFYSWATISFSGWLSWSSIRSFDLILSPFMSDYSKSWSEYSIWLIGILIYEPVYFDSFTSTYYGSASYKLPPIFVSVFNYCVNEAGFTFFKFNFTKTSLLFSSYSVSFNSSANSTSSWFLN